MRRRTFLKALIGTPTAALIGAAKPQPRPAIRYTDSSGTSAAKLAELADGNTTSGGVEY